MDSIPYLVLALIVVAIAAPVVVFGLFIKTPLYPYAIAMYCNQCGHAASHYPLNLRNVVRAYSGDLRCIICLKFPTRKKDQ